MTLMKKLLNLTISLLFFTHTSVWATNVPNPYDAVVLQEALKRYNEMSVEEKWKIVNEALEKKSPSDKEVLAPLKSEKVNPFPEIKFEDNQFLISHEKKTYHFTLENPDMVIVEGTRLDLSSGNLKESLEKLEGIKVTQNRNFMSLLIGDAHAIAPLLVLGLMAAFICFSAVAGFMAYVYDSNFISALGNNCSNLTSEYDALASKKNSAIELEFIKDRVGMIRSRLRDRNHKNICTVSMDPKEKRCDNLKKGLYCFEQLEARVNDQKEPSLHLDERSTGKTVPQQKKTQKSVQGSKAGKQ